MTVAQESIARRSRQKEKKRFNNLIDKRNADEISQSGLWSKRKTFKDQRQYV